MKLMKKIIYLKWKLQRSKNVVSKDYMISKGGGVLFAKNSSQNRKYF